MTDGNHDYPAMMEWLKKACGVLSEGYSNVPICAALVGLRPAEVCHSIALIQSETEYYYDKETCVLLHYKFPIIFIRKTKKTYLSVVDDDILKLARSANNSGYNALRLLVKRRGLDVNMEYCRQTFATYLRNQGIQAEIVDLLQGRLPKSVVLRHYYGPNFNEECEKEREKIRSLHKEIN